VVAAINLPLIDRGFVSHRKAHWQEGAVRWPLIIVWRLERISRL
jgi:hypothetical protein